MISAFQKLGTLTAANWNKFDEAPMRFAEVATAALADSGVLNTVDVTDVVQWVATSTDMPVQDAKDFGQPPVNVYVAENFYVQLLFWIDATTAIHEHGFSGAFGVLVGSSVHSRYKFELTQELSGEFKLGNVNFISSEILHKGDIRTIHSGGEFIHALFHLERPSISVVVRTNSLGPGAIQHSYLKPFVAFDPFFDDKTVKVRLRLLDSLRIARSEMFWKYAHLLMDHGTHWVAFNTLALGYQASREDDASWRRLVDDARSKYGQEVVDAMLASISEEERNRKLTRLRTIVHDPDHRFFLALLLNVPIRDTLLQLVSQHFQCDDPESLVMRWIREMADAGLFLGKCEPQLLDMINLAMRHGSPEEARAAMPNGQGVSSNGHNFEVLWNTARSIHLFQPLFKRASRASA